MLYVGEGPRGSNGTHSTLHQISVFHSATHNQIGPLWCWFPSGWACACSRPLWVSKDLSCEAGSLSCCRPNPHGRIQSEVCGFISLRWSPGLHGLLRSPPFVRFICAKMWGREVLPTALPAPLSATLSPALSVYLCGMWGRRVCSCPIRPTLHQSRFHHGHESPLHPGCPSPPLLPVWMNVYFLFPCCRTSLPLDSLSVLVVGGGTVCLPTPPSWFSPDFLIVSVEAAKSVTGSAV